MRSPVSFIIAMIFTALILGEAALCAEPLYPAEWWKPIPESEAKSWEILPQAAKKGEVILSKRNELWSFARSLKIRDLANSLFQSKVKVKMETLI